MKLINHVLLIILVLYFKYVDGASEAVFFNNYTIGSPYFKEIYRGIITPFSPGSVEYPQIGTQTILFKFVSYSASLQQAVTVNFYDQDSQLKFKVDNVQFVYWQGGEETIDPVTPTPDVAFIIMDQGKNSVKSINSLKAAQEVYSMSVTFPISDLIYPSTNKLPEYLTIGFDLPGYGSVTFNFPDNKIYFNAPAYYGPSNNQLFQLSQVEKLASLGDSTCRSSIILDALNISHSYGLYYVQDDYDGPIQLTSISTSATSNVTKYSFIARHQRSTLENVKTFTIYDALTGQSSTVSVPLSCQDTSTISSLPANLVLLNSNSRAFMYITINTPYQVVSTYLGVNYIMPTSISLPKGGFTTLIRVPYQASQYIINFPNEQLSSAPLSGSTLTVTPNSNGINVVQLSIANTLVDPNLKMNYTNSQLLFYVSISADKSLYGKVESIDYEYNGVVFYSDKEVVDNVYKKLIYIPDSLISNSASQLNVIFNSETFARTTVKTIEIIKRGTQSTNSSATLLSNQDMNLDSGGGKNYINAFKSKHKMGSDSYQIPNVQMSYFTVSKTSSYSGYSENVKIESNYPYGYTNYFNSLDFQPSIPLMPDTPGSGINCDPSYPYPSTIINDPLTKRDFVNPNIFANFTFSKDLSLAPDSVLISVQDSIGISSIKPSCKVSLGPSTFDLLSSNIYSMYESNYVNVVYQFNFKFNRYFCSSPLLVDCSDIRGNKLKYGGGSSLVDSFVSSGLNGCQMDDIPRILALHYTYNSISNVTINALFSQFDTSLFILKLSIYDNLDNIGSPVSIRSLVLDKSYPETQVFTFNAIHSETLPTNAPTVKRYISVTFTSVSNSKVTYTLSSKDLEYIDSTYKVGTVTTQVVSSQFTFRNQNYYSSDGAIDMLKNQYSLGLSKDQIVFSSTLVNLIKSITFVVRDKVSPNGLFINYDSTNSNSYQSKNSSTIVVSLSKSLTLYNELYIESFCDFYSNCYELGPYTSIKGIFEGPETPETPSSLKSTIGTPKFSRNYIDISSTNRNVKVSIDLLLGDSPFIQAGHAADPLFYITERYSNDQISCQLKQVDSSSTYSCILQIPFMFGSRGLGSCAIYGMVNPDGYLNGTRFDSCQLFLYNQYLKDGPVISEISAKMYDTRLYFYGINLNLLDSMLVDKSIFTSTKFTFLNSTSGYYTLKEKLVKPMDIKIGNKVYSVFIYTCLKDNCSGNGNCNMTSLTCSCNQGWGGTDCSIDQTFECKNACSGNGMCSVDMTCMCNPGYSGVACEIKDSNLSMNMNTSSVSPSVTLDGFDSHNLNNFTKSSRFSIELVYIQEVDILGEVVQKFDLNGSNWSLLESTNSSNTFNTTLLEYSDFRVRIDIFKQDTSLTWANEQISIPANSIKYSVRVSNYTFSSNLNRLEMFYQATPNTELECVINQQKIAWGAKRSTDMHWVTLPNNQLQLYGRFSNNLILDDRIVSTSNEGLEFGSTIQVKVNIPFFKDYVELDPDFSVLVDVNMDSSIYDECGNKIGSKSNKNKWVIPVAVVVSVVGATILFIAVFSIAYKKNITLRAKVLSIKSRMSRNGGVSMKSFN